MVYCEAMTFTIAFCWTVGKGPEKNYVVQDTHAVSTHFNRWYVIRPRSEG